uniref:K Homology domain-containing protein n=1 Tax=Plectus sambesii TaxID=2011161 RepID=A0A914W4I7_9BILA
MMMTSISDRIETAVVDPSTAQSADDVQLGNSATTAGTNMSSTTPAQRSKPRPLKLASNGPPVSSFMQSSSNNLPQQSMTVEELLELTHQINNAVKAGQFNAQLANQIFRLCQQLKISGECMEQSHRNDLNRVFVSLRQACCRDNGHLGTPCRLKIMELVELRAMGWRPSLAHSQYYLNRTTASPQEYHPHMNGQQQQQPQLQQQPQQYHMMQSTPIAPVRTQLPSHPQQQQQQQQQYPPRPSQSDSGDPAMVAGATPVSAPPFGAIPINPFGAFAPAGPPHMFGMTNIDLSASHPGPQMMPAVSQQSMAPTSYYLIPAPGAWPQTMIAAGPGMLPPPASPIGGPPPPQAFAGPPPAHSVIAQQQQPVGTSEPEASWPRGAVTKASKFSKPQKVPGKAQYRDEITIRNADSGKIMGVKGRRVAVVEELSKTIISFQKVAQGAKERSLTITGNSEETIEFAKKLIDETIRRNVSPNRPEGASDDFSNRAETRDDDDDEDFPEDDEGDEAEGDMGIQIETGEDGTLKLSCADPAVLQAAQAALSQYLNKAGQQRKVLTPEEKELRKERRKSMPIRAQSTTDSKEVTAQGISRSRDGQRRGSISNGSNSAGVNSPETAAPLGSDSPNWRALAKSTPNLVAALEPKKEPRVTAVYSREMLLRCAQSPLVNEAVPGKIAAIAKDAADIMRPTGAKLGEYERQRAAAAQS